MGFWFLFIRRFLRGVRSRAKASFCVDCCLVCLACCYVLEFIGQMEGSSRSLSSCLGEEVNGREKVACLLVACVER